MKNTIKHLPNGDFEVVKSDLPEWINDNVDAWPEETYPERIKWLLGILMGRDEYITQLRLKIDDLEGGRCRTDLKKGVSSW